jgi:hypothetical protein
MKMAQNSALLMRIMVKIGKSFVVGLFIIISVNIKNDSLEIFVFAGKQPQHR